MLQIAQVLKSNGTDGELVMGFREIAPEDINLQEPVFIVFDGLPVPFYIETFAKRGNTKALVRLTDIRSQEDVEELIGKAVYVEDDQIQELSLEEDGFAALVGWLLLTPEMPDQVGHDEDEDGYDEDEDGYDEDQVGHDEDEVGHDEDEDGYDEDQVGHDEDEVGHDEDEDGHDEDEDGHDEDEDGHDEDVIAGLTGNLIEVGEITDFIDIPNNPCIEVETENGAVMIPLHEDLILSIDPEYQEIIMQIPAGLI